MNARIKIRTHRPGPPAAADSPTSADVPSSLGDPASPRSEPTAP